MKDCFSANFTETYFEEKKLAKDRKIVFDFYYSLVKKLKKSGKLLELGCGYGFLLKRFEKDFETYGIDVSRIAIKKAKEICKNSKIYLRDAHDLSIFKSNFFDVVVALHVLEHLKNPTKVIKQISRILKKNGIFLFATPNMNSPARKLKKENWFGYRDETHISLLFPNEWYEMLKRNGFKILIKVSDGFWDSPYLPLVPATIQKPIFGILTAIQFISKQPFIPVLLGEDLIVVAKKS
jgi:SAM-dependent methyltransferase